MTDRQERMTDRQEPTATERSRWHRFGISPRAWHALLTYQNGLCGICRMPMDYEHGRVRNPCLDHAHSGAWEPRGILCNSCNAGLTQDRIDADKLTHAERAYLADPPAHKVLEVAHSIEIFNHGAYHVRSAELWTPPGQDNPHPFAAHHLSMARTMRAVSAGHLPTHLTAKLSK